MCNRKVVQLYINYIFFLLKNTYLKKMIYYELRCLGGYQIHKNITQWECVFKSHSVQYDQWIILCDLICMYLRISKGKRSAAASSGKCAARQRFHPHHARSCSRSRLFRERLLQFVAYLHEHLHCTVLW